MSKDQAIGGIILIVCAMIATFYIVTLFYPQWLSMIGIQASWEEIQFWIIAMPVFHTIHRNNVSRCMNRLDDGNDSTAEVNRRNSNWRNRRENIRISTCIAKTLL